MNDVMKNRPSVSVANPTFVRGSYFHFIRNLGGSNNLPPVSSVAKIEQEVYTPLLVVYFYLSKHILFF
jgi:hypothetical protein